MKCSNCNSENLDEAKFCLNCGTPLSKETDDELKKDESKDEEEIIITDEELGNEDNLEKKNDEDYIEEEISHKKTEDDKKIELEEIIIEDMEKEKKSNIIKIVGVIAVLLIGVFFFMNKKPAKPMAEKAPLMYVKNQSIYLMDERLDEPIEIVKDIYKSETELGELGELIGESPIYLLEDNSGMYYLENIRETSNSYIGDLMYMDLIYGNDKEIEATEIAKGVPYGMFKLSNDEKRIAYIKNYSNGKGNLYVHNLEEETKLDGEVLSYFEFSSDGNKILYQTNKSDTYDYWVMDLNEDKKEKIAADVHELLNVHENFETIYYSKMNPGDEETYFNVYKKELDGSEDKLLSNISTVHFISGDGEIVYDKMASEKVEFEEIVNYGTKKEDANMTEPNREDFYEDYEWENFLGEIEITERFNYENYSNAYDQYRNAKNRINLVNNYNENPVYRQKIDLYRLNSEGEEEKIITGANNVLKVSLGGEKLIWNKIEGIEKKLDISEVTYSSIVNNHYFQSSSKGKLMLLENGEEKLITEGKLNISLIDNNSDFSKIYVLYGENNEEDISSKLVEYSLGEEVQETEIDSDVYRFEILNKDEGSIVYYKNSDDHYSGDLYKRLDEDAEKIGTNVYSHEYDLENDALVFLENENQETGLGDLAVVKGFEKNSITHDVYNFYYKDIDEIYYFKDLNPSKTFGDLWRYKEDEEEQNTRIDYDVQEILFY